jgi:hypothetical protein
MCNVQLVKKLSPFVHPKSIIILPKELASGSLLGQDESSGQEFVVETFYMPNLCDWMNFGITFQ